MAKNKDFIKKLKLDKPKMMEYNTQVPKNSKERDKLVKRIERVVRLSMEYKDYIQYLKQNVGLDSCTFFQNISQKKGERKKVSIELHHEPFTLYDYVNVILERYIDDGLPINDLDIADEVLELHYSNMVGLVPVSKTAHEVIHNSNKLFVPLTMVYGQYSKFLEKYEEYITGDLEYLYDKLDKKINKTNSTSMEDFEAITKEFTYLYVDGQDDVEKVNLENAKEIA